MKNKNLYEDENSKLLEYLINGRFIDKWKNSTSQEGLILVAGTNYDCRENVESISSISICNNLKSLNNWLLNNKLYIPFIELKFELTDINEEIKSLIEELSQYTNTLYVNQPDLILSSNIVEISRIDNSSNYKEGCRTTYILKDNNLEDFINSSTTNTYDAVEDRTSMISSKLVSAFYSIVLSEIKKQGDNNFVYSIVENTCCNLGRFLCIDIENMNIVPCCGLNNSEFILGSIKDNELISHNIPLAIRLYASLFTEEKQLVHCNICKYGSVCRLQQYCKNFTNEKDAFLISEENCKLLIEKNKIFINILKTLDISSILDSNNMFEELKDLIDKED